MTPTSIIRMFFYLLNHLFWWLIKVTNKSYETIVLYQKASFSLFIVLLALYGSFRPMFFKESCQNKNKISDTSQKLDECIRLHNLIESINKRLFLDIYIINEKKASLRDWNPFELDYQLYKNTMTMYTNELQHHHEFNVLHGGLPKPVSDRFRKLAKNDTEMAEFAELTASIRGRNYDLGGVFEDIRTENEDDYEGYRIRKSKIMNTLRILWNRGIKLGIQRNKYFDGKPAKFNIVVLKHLRDLFDGIEILEREYMKRRWGLVDLIPGLDYILNVFGLRGLENDKRYKELKNNMIPEALKTNADSLKNFFSWLKHRMTDVENYRKLYNRVEQTSLIIINRRTAEICETITKVKAMICQIATFPVVGEKSEDQLTQEDLTVFQACAFQMHNKARSFRNVIDEYKVQEEQKQRD